MADCSANTAFGEGEMNPVREEEVSKIFQVLTDGTRELIPNHEPAITEREEIYGGGCLLVKDCIIWAPFNTLH